MQIRWRKTMAIAAASALLLSVSPASVFAKQDNLASSTTSNPAAADQQQKNGGEDTVNETKKTQLSKEKAEKLIRQNVKIPDDFKTTGTSLQASPLSNGKQQVWRFDFVRKNNNKQTGSISASVDANSGQLLQFNYYNSNPVSQLVYPLKTDRTKAKKLADEFIAEVAADYKDQIRFNEDYGNSALPPLAGEVRHSLRYDRIVNGIVFSGNQITMEIDSEGYIRDFYLNWDNTIKFPEPGKYMNEQEALKKAEQAANPQLKYVLAYNNNNRHKPLFVEDLPAFAVDAVTGELKESSNYNRYGNLNHLMQTPVTDKPLEKKPAVKSVSEEEAIAAVKQAFGLPADAVISYSSLNETHNDNDGELSGAQWQLQWAIKDKEKEIGTVYASVDAQTAAVTSFNQYYYKDEVKNTSNKPLTIDEVTAIATETVRKQLPWLTHELYMMKLDEKQVEQLEPEENRYYSVQFVHKVHGAIAEYDHVGVTINGKTGKLTNFDGQIRNVEYAAVAPKRQTKAQSFAKWMDYYKLELVYRQEQQIWYNGQPLPIEKYNLLRASGELVNEDGVETKNLVELVYTLVPHNHYEEVWLDASTGSWISREKGEPTELELPKATDIEGHRAQAQLELMISYKALDVKDGLVNPEKVITRGELIKMLVLASNQGGGRIAIQSAKNMAGSFSDVSASSDYFAYVESALQQNLIDLGDGSFNPDEEVNREEMAELIVRALGYNTLAKHEQIFNINFKDADRMKKKGQAAIVTGLQIMTLNNGEFRPEKKVSRADASVAFFRYLQQRAALHEAPLRM